ncbi:hypothetical protein SDJN02_08587 [Cucurbita argyrosperma subsp. argyrosperma]|nr:hypothetical protein SDJN02_08587 [Cucurbita argyrosperma subsp. argyrosperma]
MGYYGLHSSYFRTCLHFLMRFHLNKQLYVTCYTMSVCDIGAAALFVRSLPLFGDPVLGPRLRDLASVRLILEAIVLSVLGIVPGILHRFGFYWML